MYPAQALPAWTVLPSILGSIDNNGATAEGRSRAGRGSARQGWCPCRGRFVGRRSARPLSRSCKLSARTRLQRSWFFCTNTTLMTSPLVCEKGRTAMNLKLVCASIVSLGIGMAIAATTPAFQLRGDRFVSFRQGCEACLCKIEAVAEGRLCGDVISKQGVHVVADAIAQIVADSAHTFQPVD